MPEEAFMNKVIGVTDLQRRFRKTFDEVAEEHVPYILTRGSRPEAVLVPYDQYLRLIKADEAGILKRFDEFQARMLAANSRFTEEEIAEDVAEAIREYRKRKHAHAGRR
jgi:prevent-host-death family protein